MIDCRKFYIDGKWVNPTSSQDHDVIDPSTSKPCATISLGSIADADKAVAAASTAFYSWAALSPKERLGYVQKLADVYASRAEDLAKAVSLEMGAPKDMALAEHVGAGARHIKNFITAFENFQFEHPMEGGADHERIVHEPIGVCSLIIPWNWPLNQLTLKAIPAILTGCTVVLKPSEIAPLSSMIFAEIVDEAGLPAGVFNLVNGDGAGVGSHLSSHPDIDMVSFTGSTRAGILISKAAADSVKRVSLELGGKGANIIFADADKEAVARGAAHCFHNSGQSCNAPTRMLVERSIYDEAVAISGKIAQETHTGPSCQSGGHIGPVVSQLQFDKINSLIQIGINEGARLITGGVVDPEQAENGYFIRPTVFADVTNEMTIAREEIFGPVLVLIPFDNEDEAVSIANDTVYGLTNYLQTSDPAKAAWVARRLRSGMVRINGAGAASGFPFGGYKQSGNGREGGRWGLEEFMEVKHITGLSA